jgi:hypothetical protein
VRAHSRRERGLRRPRWHAPLNGLLNEEVDQLNVTFMETMWRLGVADNVVGAIGNPT